MSFDDVFPQKSIQRLQQKRKDLCQQLKVLVPASLVERIES